jgi:hypothetical protein
VADDAAAANGELSSREIDDKAASAYVRLASVPALDDQRGFIPAARYAAST